MLKIFTCLAKLRYKENVYVIHGILYICEKVLVELYILYLYFCFCIMIQKIMMKRNLTFL